MGTTAAGGAAGGADMPASPHQQELLKGQQGNEAVAEIDAHIARAEVTCARHFQDLKAFPGGRRTRVLLRQAEERLALLRRSREALLDGDEAR